jgi:hypothetical protein
MLRQPFGDSAVLGPSWRRRGVAGEARTRGFAAPTFTGGAVIDGVARWRATLQ